MKPIFSFFSAIYFFSFITSCQQPNNKSFAFIAQEVSVTNNIINPQGATVQTRFNLPPGFERVAVDTHSFAYYLRHLPLKANGSKVKYYSGKEKDDNAYIAVVDMAIGNKDLQQCADAIMRLRGEYFYQRKEYDSISFTLTNGFKMDYTEWMKGNRLKANGNITSWVISSVPSNTNQDFRNFIDVAFSYAGTLSLSKTLHSKDIKDIAIGDVFIKGGSPGHAEIVVDAAQNENGETVFLLAQSYMPAQETQILRNGNEETISPWYRNDGNENIITPEWTFTKNQLKTW